MYLTLLIFVVSIRKARTLQPMFFVFYFTDA